MDSPIKSPFISIKTHDRYNSSFKGQRQFLTALAIETVQMILNSAHSKLCQRKITRRVHLVYNAHAKLSVELSFVNQLQYLNLQATRFEFAI